MSKCPHCHERTVSNFKSFFTSDQCCSKCQKTCGFSKLSTFIAVSVSSFISILVGQSFDSNPVLIGVMSVVLGLGFLYILPLSKTFVDK